MSNPSRTIALLGYAGLIPFAVPALLVATGSEYAGPARVIAGAYAFGIVSFLCGSWWGLALRSGSNRVLWLSNLYFLVAFFAFVFAPAWWALAAAILLMSLFFAEQNTALFSGLPQHYRRLRIVLTGVAALSMLTIHLLA